MSKTTSSKASTADTGKQSASNGRAVTAANNGASAGPAVSAPITERSAIDLAAAIRAGELTSRQVVDAHIAVLERSRTRINAIVRDRFALARAEADAADERIGATKSKAKLPPLLGVPCTIKESLAVEGMPNSAGLFARRDFIADTNATVVERVVDAGAIPLAVTNTSELCLWVESENRISGRTNSAYSESRTSGGSSGGEGAAIGVGGSPIGIGSDLAGSIRLPAFFNGVFGHKPSNGLVPSTGHFVSMDESISRLGVVGPLARKADDLMPLLKIIAGPDGLDNSCRQIELGDPADVSLEGMSIVLVDGLFPPVRSELVSARDRAANVLIGAGAHVSRVSIKSLRRVTELFITTLNEWSNFQVNDLITDEGGDQVSIRSALRRHGPHTTPLKLLLASQALGSSVPSRYTQRAIEAGKRLGAEIEAVIGDGVMLHPPFPVVAPKHNRTVGRPWMLAHTATFNLIGLPATEIPLGLNGKGLPLGVQAIARPNRDHVSIAVAQKLEQLLGGWVPPKI